MAQAGATVTTESVDDEGGFLGVSTLKTQYLDYLASKSDEIEEQREARHYYHGAQWTDSQLRTLRRRHQPVMTWNRVNRKINGIVGLVERMRSDPKAEPTTPASEAGADIASHVIRYLFDASDWKTIEPWCILQGAIDGIFGVQEVLVKGDTEDPDIRFVSVIGDEFFYDPRSYRPDFSDARYLGIAKWVDIDDAKEMFPGNEVDLKSLVEGGSDMTTNADREQKWVISTTRRVRLVEHWYKNEGKWRWAFYVANTILDQGVSPFVSHVGQSRHSFHMSSVAIDHDGDRYGFVRHLKGPQDALNQSRSKALHVANTKRLIMEKGAVDDVEKARVEWARPDGVIERQPGMEVVADNTAGDIAAQVKFSEDAATELDSFANVNFASMQGGAGLTQISGRAIELLRQPGMAELGPFILAIRGWKLNASRAVWTSAQRFWKSERWIRVTTNEGLKQFLAVNKLDVDQWGRPILVNALGAVDVNITFEEGRDVATVMDDLFDHLRGLPPGTVPPAMLIEVMPTGEQEKAKLRKLMHPQPTPMQQQEIGLKLQAEATKNAKTAAEAQRAMAQAEKDRAAAGTEKARAAHLASQAHLAPMEFVRDTLKQAGELAGQQAQQPPPQQQFMGL